METIILDSDSENENNIGPPKTSQSETTIKTLKRKKSDDEIKSFEVSPKKIKRIQPIQISNAVSNFNENFESDEAISRDDNQVSEENSNSVETTNEEKSSTFELPKQPDIENKFFKSLLDACSEADPSPDMKNLIDKKLVRYYNAVHPDFTNSKSFRRNLITVTNEIKSNPDLVYLKLTRIIEELKIRRKSHQSVITNETEASTGDEVRDNQVLRLNKALCCLKKRIAKLEEEEVDLDDDNSSYLIVERYKKRAFEIYEKICDITGESKHAHRSVRKPITFHGTVYPEFNKAIQMFVNRTNRFPDYLDVFRILDHCNKQHDFHLKKAEIKKIAEDAFIKIGKLIQNRRKADLYETVTYFAGSDKDPATTDPELQTKLNENKKYHQNINAIIDKYAEKQEEVKQELDIEEQVESVNNSIEELLNDDFIINMNGCNNGASTSAADDIIDPMDTPATLITKIEIEDTIISENNNEATVTHTVSSHSTISKTIQMLTIESANSNNSLEEENLSILSS